MAASATGIWNHRSTVGVTAMDSGTGKTASTNSATISANDFLNLLVTEMQNQDPTANTDPNEYINQLVNVNSLEQLININQTLSSAVGSTGTTTPTGHVSRPVSGPRAISAGESGKENSSPAIQGETSGAGQAHGNLSIPDATPAAQRVAQALSGRHSAS
jgi:flagellar basal-body rod modification protein FlgD